LRNCASSSRPESFKPSQLPASGTSKNAKCSRS
jgi:hypothetical protein